MKKVSKVTPMQSNEMRQAEGFVNCSAVAGKVKLTQAAATELVKKHTENGVFNIKAFVLEVASADGAQRRMPSGIPLHSDGKNSSRMSQALLNQGNADVLLLGKVTIVGAEAEDDDFEI